MPDMSLCAHGIPSWDRCIECEVSRNTLIFIGPPLSVQEQRDREAVSIS